MNSVALTGRLTKDPELNYTPNTQTACCRFTLAVDRMKEGADFIRIVVWGKQAESCNRYLTKGSLCGVSGRIETGSYKDRDGKTIYTTDVIAERVEFLNSKPKEEAPAEAPVDEQMQMGFSSTSDDVPF